MSFARKDRERGRPARPPVEVVMHSDDIVRLTTANNPQDAHVIQQALEAEGIRSHTVGDYLDAGLGDVPGIQAEVWVPREDLERAEALLAAHARLTLGEDEEPPVDPSAETAT